METRWPSSYWGVVFLPVEMEKYILSLLANMNSTEGMIHWDPLDIESVTIQPQVLAKTPLDWRLLFMLATDMSLLCADQKIHIVYSYLLDNSLTSQLHRGDRKRQWCAVVRELARVRKNLNQVLPLKHPGSAPWGSQGTLTCWHALVTGIQKFFLSVKNRGPDPNPIKETRSVS